MDHIKSYLDNTITCSHCKTKFKRKDEIWTDKKSKTKFCSSNCLDNYYKGLEFRDKIDLWLKDYYKVDKLSPYIYKQLNDFILKGMTYQGIEYSLNWWVNIKGNHLEPNTIGIVPLIYDEAKNHYINNLKLASYKNVNPSLNSGKSILINNIKKNNNKSKILIEKIEGID